MSISVAKTVRVASAVALALSASWAVAQSEGAEGGLEEIVVTGSAVSAERRTLGNSVSSVDASSLTEKPTSLPATGGSLAGVTVMVRMGIATARILFSKFLGTLRGAPRQHGCARRRLPRGARRVRGTTAGRQG